MFKLNQRVLWMLGFVFVLFIITISILGVLTGFVQNLFEIIGNTITNTVIGEFPEIVK